MTRKRIEQLVDLLPEGANYRHRVPANLNTTEVRDNEADLLAYALHDLRFGWHYVKSFLNDKLMMPPDAHDRWIRQAFDYEYYKFFGPVMRQVFMLDSPHSRHSRDLVKALLVIPELSFEKIGAIVCLEARIIEAYEQLFFNVRDRLNDQAFMAGVIFPHGILTELQGNLQEEELGSLMLRAAAKGGKELVFSVAGMKPSGTTDYDATAAARDFEALVMTNAKNLARLGMLNGTNVPGIGHAIKIAAVSKRGGTQQTQAPVRGISQLSMGGSVVSQIMEICGDPLFAKMAKEMMADNSEAD
jgi:hypothetical protein